MSRNSICNSVCFVYLFPSLGPALSRSMVRYRPASTLILRRRRGLPSSVDGVIDDAAATVDERDGEGSCSNHASGHRPTQARQTQRAAAAIMSWVWHVSARNAGNWNYKNAGNWNYKNAGNWPSSRYNLGSLSPMVSIANQATPTAGRSR